MTVNRFFFVGIAFAAAFFATSNSFAADYYFDSVGGDDAQDGKTEATAKKALKLQTGTGNTNLLKRGSSWTGNLSVTNATVKTYGTGDRPVIVGTLTVSKSNVEGLAIKPPKGGDSTRVPNIINVMSDNTLKDCEADGGGSAEYILNTGIGVMGQNNRIFNNYVHDLAWSQSGGQMDNSGGAEGILVMGSNNEIAYNSAVRCLSSNSTLGGMEGGCYEIVNGKALATINNVSFHHNYCEQSVGMWEGCSGDFSASGGGIQDNHGIIENVTVSYNVSVDSMWLFLLQPVNTDFRNVVFANNTLIHTAKSAEYFDKSTFHYSMGNAVATYTNTSTGKTYDTDNEYYKKSGGFQLGTIIVKNNIFIDDVGSTRFTMFSTSLLDHSNNIFVPANASIGSITLGSTEKKMNLADLALTDVYRLSAGSTAAIDQGVVVNMTTDASLAQSALDNSFFENVFNQDYDKRAVPTGATVDIGASEYGDGPITGHGGAVGAGGAAGGKGGASGKGGSSGIDAGSIPFATGGSKGTGGMPGMGGKTGTIPTKGTGGAISDGGAGGTGGLGGAKSSGAPSGVGGGSGGISDTGGTKTVSSGNGTGGTSGTGDTGKSSGCSCHLGSAGSGGLSFAATFAIGLLLLVNIRRRRSASRSGSS
jgi:MYXO-CTERM domain-containing protein